MEHIAVPSTHSVEKAHDEKTAIMKLSRNTDIKQVGDGMDKDVHYFILETRLIVKICFEWSTSHCPLQILAVLRASMQRTAMSNSRRRAVTEICVLQESDSSD